MRLAARVVQRDRKHQRTTERHRDADLRDQAEIRAGEPPASLPSLSRGVTCYVCKRQFEQLHHFYDSLCPTCAELNFAKRNQTADLRGRTALVTGGRIKAGYHTVLKLLRAGVDVTATTRFPKDAARRFATEPDAEEWAGRLRFVGLDLRALALEVVADGRAVVAFGLDARANGGCRREPHVWTRISKCQRDERSVNAPVDIGEPTRDTRCDFAHAPHRVAEGAQNGCTSRGVIRKHFGYAENGTAPNFRARVAQFGQK